MKKIILTMAVAAVAFMAAAHAETTYTEAKAPAAQSAPAATASVDVRASVSAIAAAPTLAAKASATWNLVMTALLGGGGALWAMATLAANSPRSYELGNRNNLPVMAATTIFEGAAVGVVDGTGHTRPLTAVDRFAGFAEFKADNSAGAAAAINVQVIRQGEIQLAVSGALITDVGQPVYATDDDTFTFLPVAAVFVGFVKRFVSAGVAVVEFDAMNYRDPYGERTMRETLTALKTFDAEDSGKTFFVTSAADGALMTLPVIATGLDGMKVVAISGFGTTAIRLDPAAADMILGPDITGVDNKDLILTKATQRRGDFVVIGGNDADGYAVLEQRGIWVREP